MSLTRASPHAALHEPPRYTLGGPRPPTRNTCLPTGPCPGSPPQLVVLCHPVPALRERKEEGSGQSLPKRWLLLCSPVLGEQGLPRFTGRQPGSQSPPGLGGPRHGSRRGPSLLRQVLGILAGETWVSRALKREPQGPFSQHRDAVHSFVLFRLTKHEALRAKDANSPTPSASVRCPATRSGAAAASQGAGSVGAG